MGGSEEQSCRGLLVGQNRFSLDLCPAARRRDASGDATRTTGEKQGRSPSPVTAANTTSISQFASAFLLMQNLVHNKVYSVNISTFVVRGEMLAMTFPTQKVSTLTVSGGREPRYSGPGLTTL